MEHGNPCTDHDPIDDVCRSDGWKVGSGNFAKKHFIDYKLIDSLLVHTSPTPEQIKLFIMTTQARPIDSRRYMMFQGIGGDWVRFDFPNLYEVPVYKQDPDHPKKYLLKTKQEIKQAVQEYLKQKISDYNATLSYQNQKKQSYYATSTGLFDALEQIDPLATPNRHYALLQDDLFTHLLSEEMLDMLATMLFMQNSLLPYKYASASVKEEFDQLYDLANLTNKKQHIIREYLTTQQPSTPLTLPGYQ